MIQYLSHNTFYRLPGIGSSTRQAPDTRCDVLLIASCVLNCCTASVPGIYQYVPVVRARLRVCSCTSYVAINCQGSQRATAVLVIRFWRPNASTTFVGDVRPLTDRHDMTSHDVPGTYVVRKKKVQSRISLILMTSSYGKKTSSRRNLRRVGSSTDHALVPHRLACGES